MGVKRPWNQILLVDQPYRHRGLGTAYEANELG